MKAREGRARGRRTSRAKGKEGRTRRSLGRIRKEWGKLMEEDKGRTR